MALDIDITPELRDEGLAREIVNRIQNIRKETFDVTDRIEVTLQSGEWNHAVEAYKDYICAEILCTAFTLADTVPDADAQEIEIIEGQKTKITVRRSKE